MDEYIDLKIDVFENIGQHVRVLRTLTIRALIEEVLREFDEIGGGPGQYAIYLGGAEQPLEQSYTLEQLDVHPFDEFQFDYRQRSSRRALPDKSRYYLREVTSGGRFRIDWQPAVIGRPSKDPDHDMKLAVNLADLPDGETISRTHAQLTYRDPNAYIERLAESNPVYLNGVELPYRQLRALQSGDRLEIGRSRIVLVVEQQEEEGVPVKPVVITPVANADLSEAKWAVALQVEKPVLSEAPVHQLTEEPAPPVPPAPPQRVETSVGFATPPRASLKFIKVNPQFVKEKIVGRVFPLTGLPFSMGRDVFQLDGNSGISRQHAEITFDAIRNEFILIDTNSRNGVSVNGNVITPGKAFIIRSGDKIEMGQTIMEFQIEPAR